MTLLDVEHELTALHGMTVRELRDRYEDVFDEACRSNHKQWLIKRIIWRMQANEGGDLTKRAKRRAAELANDADLRLKAPKRPLTVQRAVKPTHDDRLPMPGTVLVRQYKGRELHVTVLPSGFEHEGTVYKSLSAVANAITGSHTNGFLFFGLTRKAKVK